MQFAEFLKIAKEFLNHQLFVLAGTPVSVATLLTFIAIVLVTYASSKLVGKAIERYAKRRNIADTGSIQVTTRLTIAIGTRCTLAMGDIAVLTLYHLALVAKTPIGNCIVVEQGLVGSSGQCAMRRVNLIYLILLILSL